MLLTVVGLVAAPLRLHLQFGGLGDSRQDRLAFTGTGLGLLATAVGSVLVAVGSTPATMFIIVSVGFLAAIAWLLLAWRVHALWVARRDEAALLMHQNQDLAREAWRFQAAALLARWRWAVCHPLTSSSATSLPHGYLVRRIGPEPPGVPDEWHSEDGIKLRYNWPNLVRIGADGAPEWLRDIVVIALSERWHVLRAGSVLAFYTPDGLDSVTADADHPPLVQGLVRHGLLHRLEAKGLPVHGGSRGQLLPGRDTGHLLSALLPPEKKSADRDE